MTNWRRPSTTGSSIRRAFERDVQPQGLLRCGRVIQRKEQEFCLYYVCMSGPVVDRCAHVIRSDAWDSCVATWLLQISFGTANLAARGHTEDGVMMELKARYFFADFSPHDLRDAKFTATAQSLADVETAGAFFTRLPKASPLDKEDFLKLAAYEGTTNTTWTSSLLSHVSAESLVQLTGSFPPACRLQSRGRNSHVLSA